MKIISYIPGYLVLLLPTLFIAVIKWVDIADPPDLRAPDSFWVSNFGERMWFGLAFVFPAVALFALSIALRLIGSRSGRNSHATA